MGNYSELVSRLEAAMPDVLAAQKICKTPSISLGVLHEGEIIFRKSLGLRNIAQDLEANSDTAYLIGSCSKMFTSAAIGILAEKQLSLSDTVQKHIPTFNPVGDARIGQEAQILDLCRHSTGLANPNPVFAGPQGSTPLAGQDHVDLVNALPTTNDSGQRFNYWWTYSNAAFGLLANIIESTSNSPYHTFMKQRLCEPLGLSQTLFTQTDVQGNNNVANPYLQKADGTWVNVPNSLTSEGYGPAVASMGIRSSVNDILRFSQAVMEQFDKENSSDTSSHIVTGKSLQNPLRQISSLWGWWWGRPVDDGFENDTAYTLGWLRTTMPTSALGMLSYNSELPKDDIVGRDSSPITVYGNNGITNGSLASIFLAPASHSAVVVLTNAADAGDAANTVAQILLQALFNLKPHVNLIPGLQASKDNCIQEHDDMVSKWNEHRDTSRYRAEPEEVIGTYLGLNVSQIQIVRSDKSISALAVIFGSDESSRCELEPYNIDALTFLPTDREELLARGMIDWDHWTVGVLEFVREDETANQGPIVGLRWQWDQYDYPGLWVKTDGLSKEDINAVLDKHGRFLEESGNWLKGTKTTAKPTGSLATL